MEEKQDVQMEMRVEMERKKIDQETKLYPSPLHSHEEMVKNKEAFMESLRSFHASIGTKFIVPVIGGKDLDLHLLYVEVTRRGGLEKVIEEKKWCDVKSEFKFPSTTTSASFVLRRYYLSLLYHFEQVYFFRVQGPLISPSRTLQTKTPQSKLNNGGVISSDSLHKRTLPELHNGGSHNFNVTGSIDGKFEHGYLVTIKLNNETLRGVLYHIPQEPSSKVNPFQSDVAGPTSRTEALIRRRRKRKNRDPAHPKPNRSAYNFYFAETHSKLREMYPCREKEYSKMIGESWNKLTPEERMVYDSYGAKDKERYKREMKEYKERSEFAQVNNIAEPSEAISQDS